MMLDAHPPFKTALCSVSKSMGLQLTALDRDIPMGLSLVGSPLNESMFSTVTLGISLLLSQPPPFLVAMKAK